MKTENQVFAACLGAAVLALSGCASMQVKLGAKVYLANIAVTSMEAKLPKGPGIAPGEKSPLVVSLTDQNGKVWQTEGAGSGKIMWSELTVTATVVKFNGKGVVSLPRDPRLSDGKLPHVTITAPSHPELRAELDIPVRYDGKYALDFSGSSGTSGTNGTDGMNGMSGSSGSMDVNNPSAGGAGSNGGDGTDGGDGGAGGDAPAVEIRVAVRAGSHPLLQIGVSAAGRERFFLVDPATGSLTVKADGGTGGPGGKGGRGGHGGSGGIGLPNGLDGLSGNNGRDGSNGPAGKGGLITVTYDGQAKGFLGAIKVSSWNGPRPVFQDGTVPALW